MDVYSLKQLFEERAAKGDKAPFVLRKTDFEIDIHAITGVLKLFFRELNPPLMTFELYGDFMNAVNCDLSVVKALIDKLPEVNRRVLRYLLYFLNEVAQHADNNRMRPMNLAIVFSPNLFKSDRPAIEVLANSGNAATITQSLITHVTTFFPDEEGPLSSSGSASPTQTASSPEVSQSGPPSGASLLSRPPPPPPRQLSTSMPASSFLSMVSPKSSANSNTHPTSPPPLTPPPPLPGTTAASTTTTTSAPPSSQAPSNPPPSLPGASPGKVAVPPRPLSMGPGTTAAINPLSLSAERPTGGASGGGGGGGGGGASPSRPAPPGGAPPPLPPPSGTRPSLPPRTSPRGHMFLSSPRAAANASNGNNGQ
jgi:hypothetical protein